MGASQCGGSLLAIVEVDMGLVVMVALKFSVILALIEDDGLVMNEIG